MERSPEQRLEAYVAYLRDMGIYDLYAREAPATVLPEEARARLLEAAAAVSAQTGALASSVRQPVAPVQTPRTSQPAPATRPVPTMASAFAPVRPSSVAQPVAPAPVARAGATPPPSPLEDGAPPPLPAEFVAPMPRPKPFNELAPPPAAPVPASDRARALEAVRTELGDCTRCPLAYAGRHNIVFSDGNPNAELMFVGEGPGADEDASGIPFVGKAGQLLNNMILAMGVRREDVYIANIVKCRPPQNRAPEFAEATTCSPFLVRQIDIVQPKVIVALGKTAANYLRGNLDSLTSQRGKWFETRGSKLLVTFHPAFLLRDPRQKVEAWKDLQMVMAELGLKAPKRG